MYEWENMKDEAPDPMLHADAFLGNVLKVLAVITVFSTVMGIIVWSL